MPKSSALLCLLLAISVPVVPLLAEEQVNWFVLRNSEVGNCRTAVLIRIDGEYINTFERKAGDPYATEAQALARQRALKNQGAELSDYGSPSPRLVCPRLQQA